MGEYSGRMDGAGCCIYYLLEDTGWENIVEEWMVQGVVSIID